MSEAAFWKEAKRNLERINSYSHFTRIESHQTAPGYPDVEGCINGVSNLMELKFINNNALKPGFFRLTQHVWFRDRMRAHGGEDMGMPFVFTKVKGTGYTLHRGSIVLELKDIRTKSDWIGTATFLLCGDEVWEFVSKVFTGEL